MFHVFSYDLFGYEFVATHCVLCIVSGVAVVTKLYAPVTLNAISRQGARVGKGTTTLSKIRWAPPS